MEIDQRKLAERLELRLSGRLDANWAEHAGQAIESAIRAGEHQIELNLMQLEYVSSAGIRVLMKYHKQLRAVGGKLQVVEPQAGVLSVLELSGIAGMLMASASPAKSAGAPAAEDSWEKSGVKFTRYEQAPGSVLEGRLHGHPEQLASGRLSAQDATSVRFEENVFGLGLGAFGSDPSDGAQRYGECLAVAGAALVQPTDGSHQPDYQLLQERFVPELHLLYGFTGRGKFAQLLRFEAAGSPRGVLPFSELVENALADMDCAGFAILAESACLIGASLRKSPALANGQAPWTFPEARDWLSFTTERSDMRNLVLIVGIATRQPDGVLAPFLRPIGANAHGHFHAACFPYRPLAKGNLSLKETVASLSESAESILHLIADERAFDGVGESDLVRGACWLSPLRLA